MSTQGIQGTKSVLDYTKEELQELPVEQLKLLLEEAKTGERQYWTEQTGLKLIINSLYGAMANRYFPLFNEKMAQAITGNGRFFIRLLSKNIENKLQSMLKSDNAYVTYNDTDSCVGSTLVSTNKGEIKIEDLYNLQGDIETRGEDNFINHLTEDITGASVSGDLDLEYKPIKYVMKHKVKKEMFKVTVGEDSVVITGDHSVVVLRNGVLTEVKPADITNGDKLIRLIRLSDLPFKLEIIDEFTVESLGIQEEWVYDIEVQDNHNFFGNNILIHNSIYYQIADFVDMFIDKNPNSTINEQVDFADNFEKKVIAPVIKATIEEMTRKLNIYNPSVIAADREIIADSAVFIQKKKYLARVRDNEGFRYPEYEPEIKVMGLDIIKSSTPVWSKVKLLDSVEHILDKNEQDLRVWLKNTKTEYQAVNPNELAQVGGVNNLDYILGEKGIPIGSRSALVHNQYVMDNGLEDTYAMIEAGDKTKRMFLRTPNKFNSNIVAYTNDSFIKEFDGLIDYDMMFEKGFTNALDNMTDALGYNLHKETEELDDW